MKSGKYTVDRFEGAQVVLLYQQDETIEFIQYKSFLPENTKEGDILFIEFNENGEFLSAVRLLRETAKVRKQAKDLIKKLRDK